MTTQPSSPEPVIQFVAATYSLPHSRILLADITLAVHGGETLVLLGRSGSGKTTALKLANRMLDPGTGTVMVEGKSTLQWDAIQLRRRIGYVIQEAGLFPHYTAAQNIATVPRLQRWTTERIDARVRELMDMVGLPPQEFRGRYPHELSGGQRQRVGLARALAADPPMLLMDEPFGALDPLTRSEMQQEFLRLQSQLRKSVIFVTHDVIEALTLGNHIALLDAGKVAGVFTPQEFLQTDHPLVRAYMNTVRTGIEALTQVQG